MKNTPADLTGQPFGSATCLLRGRLFRTRSFGLFDSSGTRFLEARPPAIISNEISLFSSRGEELLACRNKTSMKDAYLGGVFGYEFKEVATGRVIGGLKGVSNKESAEGVEWQIVDPQEIRIGHVTEESSHPPVRYGGRPMHDILTGFIGGQKVFLFTVEKKSFRFEMTADFSMDGAGALDRRLGMGLACLLACIKRTPQNDT